MAKLETEIRPTDLPDTTGDIIATLKAMGKIDESGEMAKVSEFTPEEMADFSERFSTDMIPVEDKSKFVEWLLLQKAEPLTGQSFSYQSDAINQVPDCPPEPERVIHGAREALRLVLISIPNQMAGAAQLIRGKPDSFKPGHMLALWPEWTAHPGGWVDFVSDEGVDLLALLPIQR